MTNKKRAQNPYKKGSKLLNTYSHSGFWVSHIRRNAVKLGNMETDKTL